jgi:tetratricopeptide (TPR) repeat protein
LFIRTVRVHVPVMLFLLLLAVLPLCGQQSGEAMQLTTSSAEARSHFEQGMARMETLHWEPALQEWRNAAQADPQFALAHIFLTMLSRDPAEQAAEREKAVATRKFAGPEEQLIIDWISNANQSRWIPAIQAMNEALERFPNDKHLAWLAGLWLENQRESGSAIPLFERANQIDPKFADPLNQAAYCYARLGNFDKAFSDMERYAALLPNEANPQDSLAEISRMAGRFDDALAHYHASLRIDPTFIESQLGLGDTYALMGEEAKAREEYAIAMAKATTRVENISFSLQSAATYVRDQDLGSADSAYQAAATLARSKDVPTLEAEAYRMMSIYQKDDKKIMELLSQAEKVVQESHRISANAKEQELALILRTRAGHAVHDGNMDDAQASLKKLAALASSNHNGRVQFAYHGAMGAVLLAQGKYQEAISQLGDDDNNPFSMQRLIVAYTKIGDKENAQRLSDKLSRYYDPSVEQAVVVPEFRKTLVAQGDKN